MITIIHGGDIFSSRNYLINEKNKNISSITLDGKNLNLNSLSQAIDSNSLFLEKAYIFIENLFSDKKGKELDNIIDYLKAKQSLTDVTLWEEKEISKKYLEIFKNSNIYLFKYPSSIFTFLDSISPQNGKKLIILFHQALKNTPAEQIMYMLTRHFRLLLFFKNSNLADPIDEIKRLSNWQKSKFENQGKIFSQESLAKIYHKLFQIDFRHKTGILKTSLSQAIDFLLLDI